MHDHKEAIEFLIDLIGSELQIYFNEAHAKLKAEFGENCGSGVIIAYLLSENIIVKREQAPGKIELGKLGWNIRNNGGYVKYLKEQEDKAEKEKQTAIQNLKLLKKTNKWFYITSGVGIIGGLLGIGSFFLTLNEKQPMAVIPTSSAPISQTTSDKRTETENFNDFLERFNGDSSFQLSRIKFPLEQGIIDPHEGGEAILIYEDSSDWTMVNLEYKDEYHDGIRLDFKQDTIWNENTVTIEQRGDFSIPNSQWHLDYTFKLINNKWYLISSVDLGY